MAELIEWFNLLGDLTRLRILRLLEREELGVGEIARIVQLPQSTVSRHLKMLYESGWANRRAVGTASMYRFESEDLEDGARELWTLARERLDRTHRLEDDAARMRGVLAERSTDTRAFFGRVGGEWDELRRELFGERFTVEALLSLVNPEWIVADLGCGTGNAAELLAPLVKKIIAVDREEAMLAAAKKRLAHFANVEFREGDLLDLPIADEEIDAAIVFLVMIHIDDPAAAVREVARALRPGGSLLIVDLVAHDRDEYRHTMGHKHLGFSEEAVSAWARADDLELARFLRLRPEPESKGAALFAALFRRP